MKMIDDAGLTDDPTQIADADKRLDVRFTTEKRQNHAANNYVRDHNIALEQKAVLLDHAHKFDDAKAARAEKLPEDPIFREIEFISIRIPGDSTMNVHRPVMASDKHRFRAQYERFKQGRGEALEGTPVEELGTLAVSVLEQLKFVGIRTIEQLANAPDTVLRIMGGSVFKQQAVAWVAKNRKSSLATQTNEALAERDAKIAELSARLEGFIAAQAALAPAEKPAKAASK